MIFWSLQNDHIFGMMNGSVKKNEDNCPWINGD